MITFFGGPLDGETREFAHGDFIEVESIPRVAPVLDFSVQTVEPFRVERHLYRRSLRNPNIFVPSMKVLDAIKIARWRFNRDSWRGYYGNRWRPDRAGWRQVIRNVKKLCEKRGLTVKDFAL